MIYNFTEIWTNEELQIKLVVTKYQNNNSLAIKMLYWDKESEYWMDYAMLTVNLERSDKLPNDCAFVDNNNIPNVYKFISDNKLGEFTGEIGFSGFCVYPCVKFNKEVLDNANAN